MDRDVWAALMKVTRFVARGIIPSVRSPPYPDLLIVRMYLWGVHHDRPQSWAANPQHYHSRLFRPRHLPSVSRFNRRIKTPSVDAILQKVHEITAQVHRRSSVLCMDGKALTVSPVSKDLQATRGHIPGGFGKGYKLHAQVTEDLRITCWSVTSLHVAEQSVAMTFVVQHPVSGCLLLADSNYDSAPLYKATAKAGITYLTHLRGQKQVNNGQHHPKTLQQMGPARRRAVTAWKQHPDLCRFVLSLRDRIERTFSAVTCYGGGLGPLPAWVRTLERVRRWVGSKIIFYHLRLQARLDREKSNVG
jgi:Transposase DDE domain